MMALANLLEHPRIKRKPMSSLFEGRSIKRSNKDLGRVLALAYLDDLDDYRPWGEAWGDALQSCFSNEWRELAKRAGDGLRELLGSGVDFEEAHHTCVYGLLASQPPSQAALRAAGNRVLGEAVTSLNAQASE